MTSVNKIDFVHTTMSFYYIHLSGKPCKLTYKEWDAKVKTHFEENFWIAPDANKQANKLINKRGMYKDTVGATQFWADYQLRPNYPIAMVVVSAFALFI